jgi:hypothetical protein
VGKPGARFPIILVHGNLISTRSLRRISAAVSFILFLVHGAFSLPAREKDATQYGTGLIVNVPLPESVVTQVVEEIAKNGIIRGTREYSKDEYITGATAASSTRVFPESSEGGKVFYKLRLEAVDPQNFKNSNDVGTIAVRYIVTGQDESHTVLRIDARFVEDFRHVSHPSNGSVEGAEYKAIHDQLDSIALMKAETAEAEKTKLAHSTQPQSSPLVDETSSSQPKPVATIPPVADAPPPASTTEASAPPQTLEQHVHDLRRQVQRLVKAPGAALKSAPFHTASTLQSLSTGTEVLVVISTPYWLGVETHAGQHGWILRDELEQLP